MMPVIDKAQISIEFPEKAYVGEFGRDCAFEVRADAEKALIRIVRGGEERREVAIHLYHYLLAGVLAELAAALAEGPPLDDAHRVPLRSSAEALSKALRGRRARSARAAR